MLREVIGTLREVSVLLFAAYRRFTRRGGSSLAASLAFFTALSLGPSFFLVMGVAGLALERSQVRERLLAPVAVLIGPAGVDVARLLFDNAFDAFGAGGTLPATALGAGVLLFASTAMMTELRRALDRIQSPEEGPPRRPWWHPLLERVAALAVVLVLGLVLAVSLTYSAAVETLADQAVLRLSTLRWLARLAPAAEWAALALLFAALYRWVPTGRVSWRQAWLAAVVAALGFAAVRWTLGVVFSRSVLAAAYGAAGSLVAFLLWVFAVMHLVLYAAALGAVARMRAEARTHEGGPAPGAR